MHSASPPAAAKKDRWASDSDEERERARVEKAAKKAAKKAKSAAAAGASSHNSSDSRRQAGDHDGPSHAAKRLRIEATDAADSLGGVRTEDRKHTDSDAGRKLASGRHVPLWHGCRSVDCYEQLNWIDEGTYGVVFRARDKETGEIVAIKSVKLFAHLAAEGFPMAGLRETNVLLSLRHPNIVRVKEMVVGASNDKVYMVMEYLQHDLRTYLEKIPRKLAASEIKCLMHQLVSAIEFMHRNWVIHRDLKTTNLLMSSDGRVVVCDFGMARLYGSPIQEYTNNVVSLWYRPPELLLGIKKYTTALDMWAVGCIFAELFIGRPILDGRTELQQIQKIFALAGTPTDENWPTHKSLPFMANLGRLAPIPGGKLRERLGIPSTAFRGEQYLTDTGMDLLQRMLTLNPDERISAEAAMEHPWWNEAPKPANRDYLPAVPGDEAAATAAPPATWGKVFSQPSP